MTHAFVFPGQGSQAVGMGHPLSAAFAPARAVFEEVDEALGQKLSHLMWDGPIEDLTLTENAQPAIMAASLAVIRTLTEQFDMDVSKAAFVAGHSLGEYSALAAAGSLSIADAARLLKLRGKAMQKAVPVGEGAMAALIGADMETAEAAAKAGAQHGVCQVANDNAPGQIVISGSTGAVDAAIAKAQELGVKRAMTLPVSAPFHCTLMQPAADAMAEALAGAEFSAPSVPVVVNVRARPESDPAALRKLLVEQVTGRVRWRESVEWMAGEGGVKSFIEAGGKVLTGMAKRTAPDVTGISLITPDDIDAFAASLK